MLLKRGVVTVGGHPLHSGLPEAGLWLNGRVVISVLICKTVSLQVGLFGRHTVNWLGWYWFFWGGSLFFFCMLASLASTASRLFFFCMLASLASSASRLLASWQCLLAFEVRRRQSRARN